MLSPLLAWWTRRKNQDSNSPAVLIADEPNFAFPSSKDCSGNCGRMSRRNLASWAGKLRAQARVEESMPLLRIDAVEGRSEVEIRNLLDATQRAVLSAFHVPQRDRYQIYHEHPQAHLVAEDTGLGITRTKNLVMVSMVSRERTPEMKQKFYAELCRELKESCGIEASDVIVSIVSNSAADWSFGNGRAQFVTGEL